MSEGRITGRAMEAAAAHVIVSQAFAFAWSAGGGLFLDYSLAAPGQVGNDAPALGLCRERPKSCGRLGIMHIKLVKSSVLAAVAAAGTSSIAVADTIDFEDVAVADGTYSNETPSFESGGFTFSQAPAANSALNLQNDFFNGQDFFGDTTGDIGHNGTTTIWSYGSVLTMAQSDGVAFNLLSLEAAEMFSATFTSDRIDVTGHLAGGGTVTTTLVLDGAYDGDGGVDDFELFTFDASWSNLTSVDFIGLNGTTYDDFGLDDIQLTLVPLPQAALMGLAGLGGVAGLKRRRRDLSTRPLKRA